MLKYEGTDKIRDIKYEDGYVDKIYYDNNTQLVFTSDKEKTGTDEVLFKGRKLIDVTSYGKCIQTNLPLEYTQLEYIESTGTQYIDTGITALDTDEIIVIGTAVATTSQFFFSQGKSSDNQAFQIANTATPNGIIFDIENYIPYRIITGIYAYNNVVNIHIVNKELFIDGISYGTSSGTLTNPTDTMRLFISSSDVMYNVQIHRFTIVGKINLIPAKYNSDNTIGMYDLVSGQFFTNAGTGNFIAGPDAVPTPDISVDIVCNNGILKARHQSGLPLGYTLLEYIESTGTQYIDTGYKLSSDDEVKVKAKFVNFPLTSKSNYIFGSYGDNANFGINSVDTQIHKMSYAVWGTLSTQFTPTLVRSTVYDIDIKLGLLTINGITASYTPSGTFINTTKNAYLFWANGTMQPKQPIAIYSFQIINNGTLVRDFVPAKNSSNVLGMYDIVNGQFFTNQGTGDFVAGNQVSDPVEIYTDGTVETITITPDGGTATAEMLLNVGDYKDEQEILSGAVTRNIGIKVLNGTEDWTASGTYLGSCYTSAIGRTLSGQVICSHFQNASSLSNYSRGKCFKELKSFNLWYGDNRTTAVADLKQFLADQYNAGTPVIVVYPTSSPVTEQVAPQVLNVQTGDNILEITQASIDDILLKVKYK